MCCETGVCGSTVDPALATFAADLAWLTEQGVSVLRAGLSREPDAFVQSPVVRERLERDGVDALPLVIAEGRVIASGAYPSRAKLAEALGVPQGVALPVNGGGCGCKPGECC